MAFALLLAATLGGFVLAALALARGSTSRREWVLATVLLAVVAELLAAWTTERRRDTASLQALASSVPVLDRSEAGYASSDTCQACHPLRLPPRGSPLRASRKTSG